MSRRTWIVAVPLAVLSTTLAACAQSPGNPPSPSAAPASVPSSAVARNATISCAMPIRVASRPPDSATVALESVAIVGYPGPLENFGSHAPPYTYQQKIGLNVHEGSRITLRVADQGSNRVAIAWGTNHRQWAKKLTIPSCGPDTKTAPWLTFPGGFAIDRPACIQVMVSTDHHTTTMRIPVGKAC